MNARATYQSTQSQVKFEIFNLAQIFESDDEFEFWAAVRRNTSVFKNGSGTTVKVVG